MDFYLKVLKCSIELVFGVLRLIISKDFDGLAPLGRLFVSYRSIHS